MIVLRLAWSVTDDDAIKVRFFVGNGPDNQFRHAGDVFLSPTEFMKIYRNDVRLQWVEE